LPHGVDGRAAVWRQRLKIPIHGFCNAFHKWLLLGKPIRLVRRRQVYGQVPSHLLSGRVSAVHSRLKIRVEMSKSWMANAMGPLDENRLSIVGRTVSKAFHGGTRQSGVTSEQKKSFHARVGWFILERFRYSSEQETGRSRLGNQKAEKPCQESERN
jgi:hypothetical protein